MIDVRESLNFLSFGHWIFKSYQSISSFTVRKLRLPTLDADISQMQSIAIAQPLEIGHIFVTLEVRGVRLVGQNARLAAQHPAPLGRTLGLPRPVEPTPRLLEAVHLRLGVHLQELLVVGRVILGIGVRHRARAGRLRARGCEHRRLRVARVERAGPARALAHVVEIGCAVRVGLGPFAVERGTPPRVWVVRRHHDARPAGAGQVDLVLVLELQLAHVEDLVLVRVHDELVVDAAEHVVPLRERQEPVAEDQMLCDAIAADHVDGLLVPVQYRVRRDDQHFRLVDQPVDGDHVLVAVLREELGELVVDVERALGVGRAVRPQDPADVALPAAVRPPVLAAGHGVQVQVHAQPVLAAVFDRAQEVAPCDLGDVWVAFVRRDRPVGERDAHVVEPGVLDVYEALLCDEGRVVRFEDSRAGRA